MGKRGLVFGEGHRRPLPACRFDSIEAADAVDAWKTGEIRQRRPHDGIQTGCRANADTDRQDRDNYATRPASKRACGETELGEHIWSLQRRNVDGRSPMLHKAYRQEG